MDAAGHNFNLDISDQVATIQQVGLLDPLQPDAAACKTLLACTFFSWVKPLVSVNETRHLRTTKAAWFDTEP